MTRSARLLAILGVIGVLLLTGTFVAVNLLSDRWNGVIPQADLFGPPDEEASPSPTPSPTPPPGADIKGPLNILLVGVDTRVSKKNWVPNADAVMIMHVNADLTHAYLTSLPRDLVVNVPAFPPARFGGARTKLTHAMSYGSRVPGTATPNPAQGFQLLARTVSNYTKISRFDAGAVLTFTGLRRVVDAVGGIDIYIDQRVVSIHVRPDGKGRTPCASCAHGYGGPQAVYNVGMRHLVGWQALDYARQRYTAGADYTRGRHQRQIIKAIVAKVFTTDLLTNPLAVDRLFKALGTTVVFDGRGRQPVEFAYALRNLRASAITLVGLPGSSVYSNGRYIGESLTSIQSSYFAALRRDDLDTFVAANPKLVNTDPQ